jgi:hypothetical protein
MCAILRARNVCGGCRGSQVTNTSSGQASAVSGGTNNVAAGTNSIVAGGQNSFATGVASIVAGGASNQALGTASFTAGTFAVADKTGEFVWADNVQVPFIPSDKFDNQNGTFWLDATNTFNVRATGGVLFVSGVNASGFPTVGGQSASGRRVMDDIE